ncbi:MAG TPA: sulfite exporter TauE/SafE family protein [Solirubrobacteraceae bacterium]|nr:sulfite exporter TauE/SafE family protein [Solirubrobacteraceae bacterium]
MLVAAVALGLAIGLVVGSVGGGGAILALPVLVYVLGQPVGPAASASLIVVAVAAAVGAGSLALRGHVCWRIALTFAPPGAIGALLGTLAATAVAAPLLVLLFVPVMLVAAVATWRRAAGRGVEGDGGCPRPPAERVLVAGVAVGLLTGFFGVGGGFMIVPVLTLWLSVGLRRAVATSLVIITLIGSAALASHLLAGSEIEPAVTVALALPTALGALLGTLASARLPQALLGRAFAVVVGGVALLLLVDVLVLGGPPGT